MGKYELWSTSKIRKTLAILEEKEKECDIAIKNSAVLSSLTNQYDKIEKEKGIIYEERDNLKDKKLKLMFLGICDDKCVHHDFNVSKEFRKVIKNAGFCISYLKVTQIRKMGRKIADEIAKQKLGKFKKEIEILDDRMEKKYKESDKIDGALEKEEENIKKEVFGKFYRTDEWALGRVLERRKNDEKPEGLSKEKRRIFEERIKFERSFGKIYKALIPIRKEKMKEFLIDEL